MLFSPSCCMGYSGPPALQRQDQIIFSLDPNEFCPWGSPGLNFQTVNGEAFSADLLADAPSFSPRPLCVFQSAEFFEMLEKMQVSILIVGEPGTGWGCCSDLSGHDTNRTHRQNSGAWREGREERTHSPDGLDHLRPFPCRTAQRILGRIPPEGWREDKQNLPAGQTDVGRV